MVGRGAADASAVQAAPVLPSLTLTLQNSAPAQPIAVEAVKDFPNRVEGYMLSIPINGQPAVLSANSTLGLFRGLTTFSQFWYDLDGNTYTNVGPVSIVKDVPAYVCLLSDRGILAHITRSLIADSCSTLPATCEPHIGLLDR